jgi:UDP-glucose 4-epimerase
MTQSTPPFVNHSNNNLGGGNEWIGQGKKPKIVVTGGAGFIGSHIVDLFLAKGYEVVVIDNLSSGSITNLNRRATFYKADIRDADISNIFMREKPDYVSHHAAWISKGTSTDQIVNDAAINILGSLNVIEIARRSKVKQFIFSSPGLEIYGHPVYLPCDEMHPAQPTNQYSTSKFTIEQYLSLYHQMYGMNYVVLRYPNIYGPRQLPNDGANIIPTLVTKMLSGVQLAINQQNDQREDYIYVTDCALANLLCVENIAASGVYNLGASHSTPINTIITYLKELISYPYTPVMNFMIENKSRDIFLDARKFQRDYGWRPTVELLEGLEQTIAYLKKLMR